MTFCLSINTYNKRFGQISFLPLELDPLTYTKDLQRAKFRKSITGHNFWLVCPTDLRSTSLSCIFNALFRDTSLAYLLSRCVCHICHVTCVTCVTYVTCQVSRFSTYIYGDLKFHQRVQVTGKVSNIKSLLYHQFQFIVPSSRFKLLLVTSIGEMLKLRSKRRPIDSSIWKLAVSVLNCWPPKHDKVFHNDSFDETWRQRFNLDCRHPERQTLKYTDVTK